MRCTCDLNGIKSILYVLNEVIKPMVCFVTFNDCVINSDKETVSVIGVTIWVSSKNVLKLCSITKTSHNFGKPLLYFTPRMYNTILSNIIAIT